MTCQFCTKKEATKEKTSWGVTVHLCENCFDCENTMTEDDFEKLLILEEDDHGHT